ncbi:TIGR01548 family HAD-type hydrolase [Cyanobium sp. Alchichica 3B3-8F6]|uniref:TIGR01548 family HAD-type hydrolase n=1 Tax=Cyanobium sp. Alchichica 3B3-8F6 TaxID=2823696 RepID=UPI0020CFA1A5|nr:TIGR01548 family HAD-type hydrolase [Cyanobium sp. Alchichica 3B3-8F6]MCP9881430.1 TIGR01548 family HAD-type hydrolase [Cyanobium sp. Alchichica 3B3-8F6]
MPSPPQAVVLFDIDGVIRDVSASYRRSIVETVHHYAGQRPEPTAIDALKSEGRWNNDWEASLELLRRTGHTPLPALEALVAVFEAFYFGGDPEGDPSQWRGFIGDEPLLVQPSFFAALTAADLAYGFVSGAEPPSCRYVLQTRLALSDPPLIAMGDAPDKPDPTGLLRLAAPLAGGVLGPEAPAVVYLGDTVADVRTVQRARAQCPGQRFLSLAVAPPHLHDQPEARAAYEARLRQAGADAVLASTTELLSRLKRLDAIKLN